MVEISSLQDTLGEITARKVAEAEIGALEVDVPEVKVGQVHALQVHTLHGKGEKKASFSTYNKIETSRDIDIYTHRQAGREEGRKAGRQVNKSFTVRERRSSNGNWHKFNEHAQHTQNDWKS